MGKTGCKYDWHKTGRQVFYDKTTFETLMNSYPKQFVEEFKGAAGGSVFDGTMIWDVLEVGTSTNPTVEIVADKDQFLLHLSADSEAQDVALHHADNKTFDVGEGLIFETRIDMAVSPGTGVVAVFGMCGDHALDKDANTEHAWFRMDASLVLKVESDDTTNDNDDVATGITLVAGTYNIFRIDFTDLTNVKFYVDGVRIASATTFDMSNLTAAEQQMQPYFSLDKASGTGLGDINIDYVKIFSNRT